MWRFDQVNGAEMYWGDRTLMEVRMSARWPLAASTLGVLEEDLTTTVGILQRHGAGAVELRSAEGTFVHTGLDGAQRAAVRARFADAGIDVFAVASQVRIAAAGDDSEAVDQLGAELRLAADLGARHVRVFPGAPAARVPSDQLPPLEEDAEAVDARAASRLQRVAALAEELGVWPALETHDSHPRGQDIARVLAALDRVAPGHSVGAIWDVLHPWRVGESLEDSAAHLLPRVVDGRGYVQIKDVAHPADTTPVLQGAGAVPAARFLELLDDAGYRGPISLEWERFWYPHVPSLDDALGAAAAELAAHPPRV